MKVFDPLRKNQQAHRENMLTPDRNPNYESIVELFGNFGKNQHRKTHHKLKTCDKNNAGAKSIEIKNIDYF